MANPLHAAQKVLKLVRVVQKNRSLYPGEHPQNRAAAERLLTAVEALLKAAPEAAFNVTEGEIFFDEQLMVEDSLSSQEFIKSCERRQINTIKFLSGVTAQEVQSFVELLTASEKKGPAFGAELARLDIKHIEVRRAVQAFEGRDGAQQDREVMQMSRLYELAVVAFAEVCLDAREGRPLDPHKIRVVVEWVANTVVANEPLLVRMTRFGNHNEYGRHHGVNATILALVLGSRLGFARDQLMLLGRAALLHDVGMAFVDPAITGKRGPLTARDWRQVKRHPVEGARIAAADLGAADPTALVAFEHHLGYDLTGYPAVEGKTEPGTQHLFSRIVQICDAYDGLTSDRPYHIAYQPAKALSFMLTKAGTTFDPVILQVFVRAMGVYPPGSLLQIGAKQLGIVNEANPDDLLRPTVQLIKKGRLAETVALGKRRRLTVRGTVDPQDVGLDLASLGQ